MTSLICFAYLDAEELQIINAPPWFDEQLWNIDGVPDAEGTPNWHQYRRMLGKLLATRFGLQMHRDKRELSVYALTVAKGGPKLETSKSDKDALSDSPGHGVGSGQYMKFTNLSMADFEAQTMEPDGGEACDRPDGILRAASISRRSGLPTHSAPQNQMPRRHYSLQCRSSWD